MKTSSRFAPKTTRWDLVRHLDEPEHPRARKALQDLLQLYIEPIYAFLRHSGYDRQDAEDMVQGFFAHAIEHQTLARADKSKGRFRTFLLTCLKQFIATKYRYDHAEKRGGKEKHISFDAMSAEERYAAEPVDSCTPETLLTRKMTIQIIENVAQELREEAAADGEIVLFEALYSQLSKDDSAEGYKALSARTSLSVSDLRSKVHRLRKRFKTLYFDRVGELCDDEKDIKAEAIAMEDSL